MTPRDDLFNPEKPYARFYESGSGQIAQIHTKRIDGLPFGRVGYKVTASATDASGATTSDASGLHILTGGNGEIFEHQEIFQSETVSDIPAALEAARVRLALMACNAAEVWRAASTI